MPSISSVSFLGSFWCFLQYTISLSFCRFDIFSARSRTLSYFSLALVLAPWNQSHQVAVRTQRWWPECSGHSGTNGYEWSDVKAKWWYYRGEEALGAGCSGFRAEGWTIGVAVPCFVLRGAVGGGDAAMLYSSVWHCPMLYCTIFCLT